jgi:tetratricopeptide (TPR) repeat protein
VDFNLANKRKASDPDNKRGWEPEPFIFHLHNLILHILNTVVVFIISLLLFKQFEQKYRPEKIPLFFPMAIIVGFFFGVHALHVESVAWVSERKDVLYSFYFLVSLLFYLLYLPKKKLIFFFLSLFYFLLSLLSKGQAVSLSVTIVVIDIFLGRSLKNWKLWIEKVPFLILSLIFGIVAIMAQKAGSAIQDIAEFYFHERIVWAAYGLTEYLLKLTVPFHLAPIYPYPYKSGQLPIAYWLYIIPALAIVGFFVYLLKKNRLMAFGMAFYFVNIFLLLQILPVGSAVMADRYAYIPSIGYFILLAALLPYFYDKKINLLLLYFPLTLMISYNIYYSIGQSKIWQNSLSLWNRTLELEPKAVVAWNNRGSTKEKFKMHEDAIKDFDQAILLKPDYAHAYYNRGTARKALAEENNNTELKAKILDKAMEDFNRAVILLPSFDQAYHNRGIIFDMLGQFDKALEDFNKAMQMNPNSYDVLVNRGVVYGKMGDFQKAINDFNTSIKIQPNNASAYSNLGLANDFIGNTKEAIANYDKAIELDPSFATAYSNRALIYKKLENYQAALNDFTKAIAINPNFSEGYYHRGTVYLLMNQKNLGCTDFQTAVNLGYTPAQAMIDKYCK